LADDNAEFRKQVKALLADRHEWDIYAEAADGAEAVAIAKASYPNLAILDISMPIQNGIVAGQQIVKACPQASLLAVSAYEPEMFIGDVIESGFHGFVAKAAITTELIPAVENLLRGDTYFRFSRAGRL